MQLSINVTLYQCYFVTFGCNLTLYPDSMYNKAHTYASSVMIFLIKIFHNFRNHY